MQHDHFRNLIRLSTLTSSYFAKFMKHNKSNTAFLHEIVIIFSPIVHLCDSSFNLMTEL